LEYLDGCCCQEAVGFHSGADMKILLHKAKRYWRDSLHGVKRVVKHDLWKMEEFFSNKTPVYIIGDSHAGYFRFDGAVNVLVRMMQIPGATAYGLVNENSISNSRKTIKRLLQKIDRRSVLVFQFGEVDCAFSIWKRVLANGTSPIDEVNEACESYLSFIKEVKELGFATILVATVPPPTVYDWGGWHGSPMAAFRQQIEATIHERTECARMFNHVLRSLANTGLYRFIDVESCYLDKETGLVKTELRMENDLHLNWTKAREINYNELKKMGVLSRLCTMERL
jgi:hypothetical protein